MRPQILRLATSRNEPRKLAFSDPVVLRMRQRCGLVSRPSTVPPMSNWRRASSPHNPIPIDVVSGSLQLASKSLFPAIALVHRLPHDANEVARNFDSSSF